MEKLKVQISLDTDVLKQQLQELIVTLQELIVKINEIDRIGDE